METVLRTLAAVRNPTSPKEHDPSPAVPSLEGGPEPFLFAVADGGLFSPEALWYRTGTALERLLLCRVPSAEECWRVALEATESGLFRCGLVHPSQGASPQLVRRLQLAAERTGTALWLVTDERIPHWALRRGKGIGHAPQKTLLPRVPGKR